MTVFTWMWAQVVGAMCNWYLGRWCTVRCVCGILDCVDGAVPGILTEVGDTVCICHFGQEFMAQCVSDINFGTRVYGAVCI